MTTNQLVALERAATNNALGLAFPEWLILMACAMPSSRTRPLAPPQTYRCRCERVENYRKRVVLGQQIFNHLDGEDLGSCPNCLNCR